MLRSSTSWVSVSDCCGSALDSALARLSPASFSDCLPACPLPLRFLFTTVYLSCPSDSADICETARSATLDPVAGELMPAPNLLRLPPLLVLWLAAFCCLEGSPTAYGDLHHKVTFLLPGRSLLHCFQYSLQQHRLLHDCLCYRLQVDFQR